MFAFLKSKNVHARLVRRNDAPCLLVAFKTSAPPLIWQLDLEKTSTHVISLRETNGEWDLGLTTNAGVFSSVAHFDERPLAEEAYDAIQAVLVRDNGGGGRAGGWGRWILFAALAIFLGILVSGHFASTTPTATPVNPTALESAGEPTQEPTEQTPTEQTGPKEIQNGVPMSADDVLTAPPEE